MTLSEAEEMGLAPGALIVANKMMYEIIKVDNGVVHCDDCVKDERFLFIMEDVAAEFVLVRKAPCAPDTIDVGPAGELTEVG